MTYSYDALARLQYATAGPTGTPTWKLGFVYDRYGNRTQQNLLAGTGFATQTPTDPVTNRLNSPNVYDASGNVTNDTLHTYTVACPERSRRDAENRIQTVDSTAATYTYTVACPERSRRDGGPLRVKEVVTGATVARIYSGSKLIAYYVNGALAGEYVYAGETLVAGLDSNGTRIYHHPDHLTQRVLTNPSGGVEWTGGHYPFGESWYQPTGNDSWRFTTYLRYSESGLDYAIFRDYSTRLGRFMQQDLLTGKTCTPQSLNRYAYVGNDPVDRVDPLGLCGQGWERPSGVCRKPPPTGGPGDHPPLEDTPDTKGGKGKGPKPKKSNPPPKKVKTMAECDADYTICEDQAKDARGKCIVGVGLGLGLIDVAGVLICRANLTCHIALANVNYVAVLGGFGYCQNTFLNKKIDCTNQKTLCYAQAEQ